MLPGTILCCHVQARDSNTCTEEKEALGKACRIVETMMDTAMKISQSPDLCEEQEKKKPADIFKTSLVNYPHADGAQL